MHVHFSTKTLPVHYTPYMAPRPRIFLDIYNIHQTLDETRMCGAHFTRPICHSKIKLVTKRYTKYWNF